MEVTGGARQSTRCRSTGPVRDVGRGLGCQFLFIKIRLEGLSPPQVVLGRLLTGSAALVTASLVSGQRPPREPTVWAHLAMMSVLPQGWSSGVERAVWLVKPRADRHEAVVPLKYLGLLE